MAGGAARTKSRRYFARRPAPPSRVARNSSRRQRATACKHRTRRATPASKTCLFGLTKAMAALWALVKPRFAQQRAKTPRELCCDAVAGRRAPMASGGRHVSEGSREEASRAGQTRTRNMLISGRGDQPKFEARRKRSTCAPNAAYIRQNGLARAAQVYRPTIDKMRSAAPFSRTTPPPKICCERLPASLHRKPLTRRGDHAGRIIARASTETATPTGIRR